MPKMPEATLVFELVKIFIAMPFIAAWFILRWTAMAIAIPVKYLTDVDPEKCSMEKY
jgi:hypothetical protein